MIACNEDEKEELLVHLSYDICPAQWAYFALFQPIANACVMECVSTWERSDLVANFQLVQAYWAVVLFFVISTFFAPGITHLENRNIADVALVDKLVHLKIESTVVVII